VRNVEGGRVRVEVSRDDAGSVCVHVCDNGPGVPAEIRDTLFQPFVSRRPGGTGLGLAIVAKIMLAHGGSVSLDSREPWTTCFTLRFPPPVISP
jgi:signal transduction histidine kinase